MPVYHSLYDGSKFQTIGGMALLPFQSKFKGPAAQTTDETDIVEESLLSFRVNCFFKHFDIKSSADRTLIYGILYISDCLSKIKPTMTQQECYKTLQSYAVGGFALPGDAGFPLNALYPTPANKGEYDQLKAYILQMRQEISQRFTEKVYSTGQPSKWWLAFQKKKFLNKSLA